MEQSSENDVVSRGARVGLLPVGTFPGINETPNQVRSSTSSIGRDAHAGSDLDAAGDGVRILLGIAVPVVVVVLFAAALARSNAPRRETRFAASGEPGAMPWIHVSGQRRLRCRCQVTLK